MAAQNSPQGLAYTPNDTMAFDSINGILGTGGRKAACRGKQGGNQELICPDQGKKKMSAAFLQKIFHKFTFSCISFLPSRSISFGYKALNGNSFFYRKDCLLQPGRLLTAAAKSAGFSRLKPFRTVITISMEGNSQLLELFS